MGSPDPPRGWKTAARARVRSIVATTPDGPVTGDDGAFLASLLTRHPDAAAKIGPGIAWISLGPVPGKPSRGFTVHRTDRTSTDFSWRKCITLPPHKNQVLIAMREAIVPQVLAYRDSREPLSCAFDPAHPGPFHVDHADPDFITLADLYAAAQGGYDRVPLRLNGDGDIGTRLHPAHELAWASYHREHARFRILCQPCNCNGQAP
jgi:hypothetical protein